MAMGRALLCACWLDPIGHGYCAAESDERRYRTASLETTPTTSVTALEHKVSDNMV